MHVLISHPGFSYLYRFVISSQYDIINLFLAGQEFPTDRNRTGKVRTIMGHFFCSGIRQHHTSFLKDLAMIVIMECFTVLRQDHRERHHTSVRSCNSFDQPCNILFLDSRFTIPHSSCMHFVTDITSFGDFLDFTRFFYRAEIDHSFDQFQRSIIFHQSRPDTQQLFEQEHIPETIRR